MIGVDELLDWTKAEPEEVDNLKALERAAVEYLNEPGGRYWGLTAELVEEYPWRGETVIQLGNAPAGTVEVEEYDGSAWVAVAADRFRVSGRLVYMQQPTTYRSPRWPTPLRFTYDAGYEPLATDPDVWEGVPEDIKQAVRMLVSDWYEHPEGVRETSADVAVAVRDIMRKYQ